MPAHRLRISGGSAGGLSLQTPKLHLLRPTQDRVRQAVFSSLGNLVLQARVLDLFAGVGSYGLEALSRGAASAHFVEQNAEAALCIKANLAHCKFTATLDCAPVLRFLDQQNLNVYDLIFADPPYQKTKEALTFEGLLSKISSILQPEGLLVWEYYSGQMVKIDPGWEIVRERRYGETGILCLQKNLNKSFKCLSVNELCR